MVGRLKNIMVRNLWSKKLEKQEDQGPVASIPGAMMATSRFTNITLRGYTFGDMLLQQGHGEK